jgi:hypothetical protein
MKLPTNAFPNKNHQCHHIHWWLSLYEQCYTRDLLRIAPWTAPGAAIYQVSPLGYSALSFLHGQFTVIEMT